MCRMLFIVALTSLSFHLPCATCRAAGEPKLQIDADFAGGNIVLDKIKGDD